MSSFFRRLSRSEKGSRSPSPGSSHQNQIDSPREQGNTAARSLFADAPPAYSVQSPGGAGSASSYYSGHPQNQSYPQQSQQYPPAQNQQYPPAQNQQYPPPQQHQQYPPAQNLSASNAYVPNRTSFPLPSANPTVPLGDDPYSFLASFDTVLVIDDSGSMAGGRWRQASEALASIVGITTYYDKDGVDIYFLNQKPLPSHRHVKSPEQVMDIFRTVDPRGATPTGQRLNQILKEYINRYKTNPNGTKPLNIIVITDGSPTDDLESVIVQHARKLDSLEADLTQVGIQFCQIGNDASATEALKELDDALGEMKSVRDMVDTVPYRGNELRGDYILKVVLGAVVRRLDRKKA